MNADPKAQAGSPQLRRPEGLVPGNGGGTGDGRVLVTRVGLAGLLGVSVRTVDRMLAAGEIAPVRMRGWSVRFYVPEVVECLKGSAATRKNGRGAATEFQFSDFKFEKGDADRNRGTR
jgi:excisionase family DNA binding protein